MIATVVQAHVAEEQWAALQDAYTTGVQKLPPGIVQTFLLHDLNDRSRWQIMTIWESVDAALAMRSSGQTPTAITMFGAAGVETTHSALEIVSHAEADRQEL